MAGKKYLLAVETEFILGPTSHVLVQWEGVFVYVCYYFVIRQSECPGEEQQQETRPGFPVALWGKTDEVSQGFTTHPKSNTHTHIYCYCPNTFPYSICKSELDYVTHPLMFYNWVLLQLSTEMH